MPNPLFDAIEIRNANKVLELLSRWFRKPDVNEISSEGPWQGWTPLMAAAYVLSVPSLRHLAKAGAEESVNKVCTYDGTIYKGLTALHIACMDYAGQRADINRNYPENLKVLQQRAYFIQLLTTFSDIKSDLICAEGKFKGFAPLHIYVTPCADQLDYEIDDNSFLEALNITFNALKKSLNQLCLANPWRGCSPLHMVILLTKRYNSYRLSIISSLIENGANVNLACGDGQWEGCTPLHLASLAWPLTEYNSDANYGKSIISLLIGKGADINFVCSSKGGREGFTPLGWEGFTPLMMAICEFELKTTTFHGEYSLTFREVKLEIISSLIEQGANVNSICSAGIWKGYSPLAMSAALKDEKISEILIKKGADIDAAIFYFQRSYSTDVVKFLLTLRTQLKIKNVNVKKDGNTKLHLACENIYSQINFSIVHELINPSNDSKYQDTDSAQYLNVMITPEDPNKTNHRLETALMVALKANGDPDETANITTLLFPLTNLEILDLYYGRTAFMWVCLAKKQIKSFDALYSRCYDFEQPDKEGHTPFLLSVIGDALHYIEKLIQKPVNVSALNNLDEDALMLAGKKENNSVGKMLITYGVPINRISKKTNKSALNLAIENKNIILCFALIASRLLFCIAREILPTPNVKTLDFLFEQGGHLNQRDERGQTLFHVRLNDSFFAYVFQLEGAESCKSSAVDFSGRNVETALKENKKVEYNFKDISNNLSTLNGLAKEKNQNPIWQKLLPLCQKVLSATEPAKNVVREESSTADDVNTKQKSSQSQSKKSNKSAFFSEPEEAAEVKRKTTETPPIKEDIPVKKKHRL